MAELDKQAYKAQKDFLYQDNTNEDIAPIDFRSTFEDSADSFPFLIDEADISGQWTFSTNPYVPLVPTDDSHAASKKYVDDNAGVGAGDVIGPASSINNEIVVMDGLTGKLIKGETGVLLSTTGDFSSMGDLSFSTASKTINGIEVQNLLDKSANETVSGGWSFDSNVTIPLTPLVDSDAASKKYVDDNASGGGDVFKVGTPVNNQLGVWTGDGTIEGDGNLTWSGSTLAIGGNLEAADVDLSGNLTLTDGTISVTKDLGSPLAIRRSGVDNTGTITSWARESSSGVFSTIGIINYNLTDFRLQSQSGYDLVLRSHGNNEALRLDNNQNSTFANNILLSSSGGRLISLDVDSSRLFVSGSDAFNDGGNIALSGSTNSNYTEKAVSLRIAQDDAMTISSSSDATFYGDVSLSDGLLQVTRDAGTACSLRRGGVGGTGQIMTFARETATDVFESFCIFTYTTSAFRIQSQSGYDLAFRSGGANTSLTLDATTQDGTFTNDVYADNFILSSDARDKEIIDTIGEGLVPYYKYKRKGKTLFGTTAQAVEKKYPEIVQSKKDGKKAVSYIDLLCMEIADLNRRLKILEK